MEFTSHISLACMSFHDYVKTSESLNMNRLMV